LTIEPFLKKPSYWKDLFKELNLKENDDGNLTFLFLIESGMIE